MTTRQSPIYCAPQVPACGISPNNLITASLSTGASVDHGAQLVPPTRPSRIEGTDQPAERWSTLRRFWPASISGRIGGHPKISPANRQDRNDVQYLSHHVIAYPLGR
jgi:hypothetical protein